MREPAQAPERLLSPSPNPTAPANQPGRIQRKEPPYPEISCAGEKQHLPYFSSELYTSDTSKLSRKEVRIYIWAFAGSTEKKHSKPCPNPSALSLWSLAPPVQGTEASNR